MRFEITQTEEWEAFQKASGRSTRVIDLACGEKALFIKFNLPLGKSWLLGLGVNFEKFSKEDFERLIELGKSLKATHIRCEGYSINDLLNPESSSKSLNKMLGKYSTKDVSKSYLPQHTIKVDLSLSEEEILGQMKRKGRYNIQVAKKAGVVVEHFTGWNEQGSRTEERTGKPAAQALEEFYSVLKETGGRDGFGIHPKAYYEKMLSSLGDKAHLYVARLSESSQGVEANKVIAGMIVIYSETEAVYYYGASSNEHRNVMAPYLLQWSAMTDAKKVGKIWYDFMGVAEPQAELLEQGVDANKGEGTLSRGVEFNKKDPLYGVTEFKQKFGGQVFVFEKPIDVVLSAFWYRIVKLVKRLRS